MAAILSKDHLFIWQQHYLTIKYSYGSHPTAVYYMSVALWPYVHTAATLLPSIIMPKIMPPFINMAATLLPSIIWQPLYCHLLITQQHYCYIFIWQLTYCHLFMWHLHYCHLIHLHFFNVSFRY